MKATSKMKIAIKCRYCNSQIVEVEAYHIKVVDSEFYLKFTEAFEDRLWSDPRDPDISYLVCMSCGKLEPIFEP